MQRVFRNPYSGFKGTVTIEVNNGKYSNYVCRDEMIMCKVTCTNTDIPTITWRS